MSSVNSSPHSIAVLGAGISGLTTAYYISKLLPRAEIKIFEGSTRAGGCIRTVKKNGILFEEAAKGIPPRGRGQDVLDLVQELDLWSETIAADAGAKARYVLLNGAFKKVPVNAFGVLKSPLAKGLLPALRREWSVAPGLRPDCSVAEFVVRHFGEGVLERAFDPFISGTRGGDPGLLSAQSCLPMLSGLERTHGSILKAMIKNKLWKHRESIRYDKALMNSGYFSFVDGMETIVTGLVRVLKEYLQLDHKVLQIARRGGRYTLYGKGFTWDADLVVSTLPSYQVAALAGALDRRLQFLLRGLEYAPMAVISLAWDKKVNPCKGFGYLVPRSEGERILGASWNDQVFPEQYTDVGSVCTFHAGGDRFENFSAHSRDDFFDMALDAAKRHLGIKASPVERHFVGHHAVLPQMRVGHADRLKQLLRFSPDGLILSGTYVSGSGVSAIVQHARTVAGEVKDYLRNSREPALEMAQALRS